MKAKVSSRAILLPALALFALPGLGHGPATGAVSLRDWLAEPGATLRAR